jgi:TPR repeat protein/predicted aspartyl protease
MRAPFRRSNCLYNLVRIITCFVFGSSISPNAHPGAQNPTSPSSISDLKHRAESGDSAAAQDLVNFLLQADAFAPGYDIAQAWVRSWASRNDPSVQFLLGYFYEFGRGVRRDYAKAAESYQQAALQGYAMAQNNLARLYSHGLGVHKDTTTAFRLFLAAAQQRLPTTEWNLGHAYYEGVGTPRNLPQAARCFRAAAEHGDSFAQHDLAALYLKGLGVAVDYVAGARWESLAAQQGDPDAEAGLGYLYETGKGVPLDYVAAYAWYSRAATAGQSLASRRCKSLSYVMTPKQLAEANSFFDRVSLLSNATIPFQLGSNFLIVVDGQIGPLTSLKFILDTGAIHTVVDHKIADELLLPRHRGKVLNFDKYIKVAWTSVPELRLGPLTASNFPVMVGDLKHFSDFAKGIDAIIGLDLLSATESIVIDYRSRFVTMKASGGCPVRSLYTAFTIQLPIQGQSARLIVDTGLQGIFLYEDRLRQHLPQLKLSGPMSQAYAGRTRGRAATLTGIRLGADQMQASVLLLPVTPASLPDDIDGYIGTNALHAEMVELDFAAKELRWQ